MVEAPAHIPIKQAVRFAMLRDVAGERCRLAAKVHRTHRGSPISFKRFPFQRAMYKDPARKIVVVGCVQKGKTEWATITVLATLLSDHGLSALYIMPDRLSLGKFIETKFDASRDRTPAYKGAVKDTDNKNVKQIGGGFVTFGISSREADFANVTCDLVVIDELELCAQSNLKLAADRMEESDLKAMIVMSNPRHRGGPIEEEFADSDQKHWHADCGNCGESCKVGWFESVVRPKGKWYELRAERPMAVCSKCNEPLDIAAGYWKPDNPGHPTSGYRMNHVMAGSDLGEMWLEFNQARNDPEKLQRMYNSRFGLPFTAPGAGLTEEMLEAITESKRPNGQYVAGIDLHGHDQAVIILDDSYPVPHVLAYEKCRSTEETGALLQRYGVTRVVSDSEPGGMFVREWADRNRASGVKVALGRNQESKYQKQPAFDDKSGELRFHRTWILDNVLKHVQSKLLTIEPGLRNDFAKEMTASSRFLDVNSEPAVYRWTKNVPNHAMFSLAYALLASEMLGHSVDVGFRSTRTSIQGPKGF